VVSVSSDGGFGQYTSEFTTAVNYGMDITHVLLNDDELGKISKKQRTGGWDVWQTDLVNPGFAAFAENCGGYGVCQLTGRTRRCTRVGTRVRRAGAGRDTHRLRAGVSGDGSPVSVPEPARVTFIPAGTNEI
jgi:hypothetical protein